MNGLNGDKKDTLPKSTRSDLSKDWYLDFLVTQNTKDSLEQTLVLRPSDPFILQNTLQA